MARYADQIARQPLYEQLKDSAGRDRMSETDVDSLAAIVCQVADRVGPLLDRIAQTFPQYTDHGFTHANNVIDLMGRFIPQATLLKLNALEIAMLLLAGVLHDTGMVVSDDEKRQALASEGFAAFATAHANRQAAIDEARSAGNARRVVAIEDALLAEYFRSAHPERARQFIQSRLADKLTFGEVDLSDHLATLCESHGWGVRESNDSLCPDNAVIELPTRKPVSSFPVNMQYLACCLRLADIMDFARSRTPLSLFHHIDFTEKKSWTEWIKHLQVTGWTIDEHEVLFAFACTHLAFYVAVHEFLDAVDTELRECRYLIDDAPARIAQRYQINLPTTVDRRQVAMKDKQYVAGAFRFQLEYDDIMRILMDKSLYPDPSLFLRELLQNALDACRHKEALWKEKGRPVPYKPRIVVWDHSDDPDAPRIIFQDNGVGMSLDIVENYFMRVGKSYYRSPQFQAERQRLES
ncbi:MAG: hypothetical protein IMF16_08235, partial [Proteobacteria bacterium]|nr:hypothetical protein [Pseudomonadota bacterium]